MNDLKDLSYLRMAYALAAKAKGWASPNPYVGTVIVRGDVIVGYGYHEGPGKPHAEIIALQRAGSLAEKSTAYITLEPCVHWGRTPPCVESLIQAGLKKIVISDLDVNPVVYKRGLKKIREAGIEVTAGLLKEKNKILNESYLKYITQNIPFVTAKAALSLDGKIATKKFSSRWISSAPTREYIHLLRGEYDAIMIGINTLLKDNPRLTVRHANWKGKKVARIILDAHLRFPMKARILSTLNKGKIVVLTLKKASQRKADALRKKGVEVVALRSASSFINLKEVLAWLGKQEISSLLVEGGARLLSSMFEEKLVDKVLLSIAPRLIGGKKAPSLFQGDGVDHIKDSLCLKRFNYFQINEDCLLEGYL
jgi:diaminohydroxyphosphoribosylaminopyrimidine deaminase/5-amino-6-(5-phosphoribosylamino)uracil reductase